MSNLVTFNHTKSSIVYIDHNKNNTNLIFTVFTVIAKLIEELILKDPVFCPNACGRSYSGKHRKGNLKRHLSFECGVMSLFKYRCDICYKIYTRKESLTIHRVNSHNVL